MRVLLIVLLSSFLSLAGAPAHAQLARLADWQVALARDAATRSIVVRNVMPDSPAARAGLQAGDTLVAIAGTPVADAYDTYRARHRSKGGVPIAFDIARAGRRQTITFTPRARPLESHPTLETRYDNARSARGADVRLVITRPKDARGPLPALVFIPWMSCDAVDYPNGPQDGWGRMLTELARESGLVMVRIEKPGSGDSTGPACMDADLEDDLAAFRAGLRKVETLPEVAHGQVVLMGGSIGASLVPVLAQGMALRGILAAGGHARTWFEHMLDIERDRLTLSGTPAGEVDAQLRGFAEFYAAYLIGGATPGEVIAQRPHLAPMSTGRPAHQYDRPARYFQQLQQLAVGAAWAQVEVPVLVVFGEHDWIMQLADQQRIVALVNAKQPGRARLAVIPGMDHHFLQYPTRARAFAEDGGTYARAAVDAMLGWLREVLPVPAASR